MLATMNWQDLRKRFVGLFRADEQENLVIDPNLEKQRGRLPEEYEHVLAWPLLV